MKSIPFLVLWLGIIASASAQVYTVVKVAGKVESPNLKRIIQSGDKISAKDQLKFEGKDAYIIVTSAKTGNKKIAGIPDAASHEFMQLLESFIKPGKKATASRSFGMDYFEALSASMNSDSLLILGDGVIKVNTAKLPLASPAAIKVFYPIGKEQVYRKISTLDGFCLSEKCLFDSAKQKPMPKVALFYYEDELESSTGNVLGVFIPWYTNEVTLLAEVKALAAFVSTEKKEASVVNEIKDYLAAEYARVQEDNLKSWLLLNGVITQK